MAKSALATQPLSQVRILLVEDNSSDAAAVENLLDGSNTAHYKTLCVKTQTEAIKLLMDEPFDVCLLDLTLPDAIGFSALVNIQEKVPDLPVLILTGMNDTALAKNAVGHGAQDYLLKDEMEAAALGRAIDYAMERKNLEKNLFQRANYDALTGLANRELFFNCLTLALVRADRTGLGVVVFFIDLDRFKNINDVHGHDAGDEVLKTVAERIKSSLRAYETSARFGGDEFAVLLEGIKNPRDAANIAQKIIKAICQPIAYHNHHLEISASIGIAYANTPANAEMLLQHADVAMYHAKKEGNGAYRFYADSMQDEANARLSMEEDLRTALASDELRLYYQPYFSGKKLTGVEALLRWSHPERGMVCAQDFLAVAETARLMPEIGRWVCSQLRHDIAMWNAHHLPPMNIAMNLSVSQLDTPGLLAWITPVAQEDFLGTHRLTVEIPEEAITPISGARFMTLGRLHEMGVGLHLDHFGHRALPLTTLCSLPFSLLKIDRSLIRDMSANVNENVLISAAIMLAHHLGLKAGAVGIETEQQAETLSAHACDVTQGFLTVQPMTAEKLVEWLKRR